MRILMITPYVTINSRPELARNKTGFGYMVNDIAKSIGKLEQVDVLCSDSRGGCFEVERVKYLERSYPHIIKNLLNCLHPHIIYKLWDKYRMSNGTLIRLVYYWLMTGYLAKLIRCGGYDVVHIHGCSFSTDLWMLVCNECHLKFVVTLHGLDSFSETVRLEPAGKRYERDFLKRVAAGEFPITVISTGMKRFVENTYGVKNCNNISVVCNSFSFLEIGKVDNSNIRKQYNIPENAKVILYVGNISKNKNQTQMVRAFTLLPEDLQRNTYVLFCGQENDNTVKLHDLIYTQKYADHLIMCGGIDRELMPLYYETADGVVLLSFAEGFGLSLIEGMHFGLPCVLPVDLDAYEDIYDESSVVAVTGRSDAEVSEAIGKLLTKVWDSVVIKVSSRKFESSNMAIQYIDVYQKTTI